MDGSVGVAFEKYFFILTYTFKFLNYFQTYIGDYNLSVYLPTLKGGDYTMEIRQVKILLVPTKEQRQAFYDSAYYSDKMYNQALQWNIDYYQLEGKFYSRYDLIKMLPLFKQDNPEYCKVDSYILKSAVTDLRVAFNRRKSGSGFPKFKKIGRKLSFGVRGDRLKVFQNMVQIPSIGRVKCKHCHWLTRNKTDEDLLNIKYHNPHIKFDGKYWFLVIGIEVVITPDITTDEVVGIDLGIKNTICTSNVVVESNINYSRKVKNLNKRKKRLQRKISRKYELNKQGNKFIKTKNIKKLERQVRLIDRKLHNIRENYIHTITNKIIRQFPKRIMLEDLKVKNMMKNKYLARSIQEQQFYRIRQLLIEKAKNTQSVGVGLVAWNYPSSKKCSRCGYINKHLKLSDRIFVCPSCDLIIDRDYNASLNIRDCKDYKLVN